MAKTNYIIKREDIMDAVLRRCTAKFKDIDVGIQTVKEFEYERREPTRPIRKTDKYVVTTYLYGSKNNYSFTGRGKNAVEAAYESLHEAEKGIVDTSATARMFAHLTEFVKLFEKLMVGKSAVVYTVTKVDTEYPTSYVHREFSTREKAAEFVMNDYNIVHDEERLNGQPVDLSECMEGMVYHTDERNIRYIVHPVVVFEDEVK